MIILIIFVQVDSCMDWYLVQLAYFYPAITSLCIKKYYFDSKRFHFIFFLHKISRFSHEYLWEVPTNFIWFHHYKNSIFANHRRNILTRGELDQHIHWDQLTKRLDNFDLVSLIFNYAIEALTLVPFLPFHRLHITHILFKGLP